MLLMPIFGSKILDGTFGRSKGSPGQSERFYKPLGCKSISAQPSGCVNGVRLICKVKLAVLKDGAFGKHAGRTSDEINLNDVYTFRVHFLPCPEKSGRWFLRFFRIE
jgi:hypothetical protein